MRDRLDRLHHLRVVRQQLVHRVDVERVDQGVSDRLDASTSHGTLTFEQSTLAKELARG